MHCRCNCCNTQLPYSTPHTAKYLSRTEVLCCYHMHLCTICHSCCACVGCPKAIHHETGQLRATKTTAVVLKCFSGENKIINNECSSESVCTAAAEVASTTTQTHAGISRKSTSEARKHRHVPSNSPSVVEGERYTRLNTHTHTTRRLAGGSWINLAGAGVPKVVFGVWGNRWTYVDTYLADLLRARV